MNDPQLYEDEALILFSSHYLLYVISELADRKGINKDQQSYAQLIGLYDPAMELLKQAVIEERTSLGIKEKYLHGVFFKSNKPKLYIQKTLGVV